MDYYTFEKEGNRWYVVLPEWQGDKEDLEMVCGADIMLDIIAQGRNKVRVGISTDKREDYRFKLTFKEEESGGGIYELKSNDHSFDVWLCYVTKFVFGELPINIYVY